MAEVVLDHAALLEVITTSLSEIIGDGAIVNLVEDDGKLAPLAMRIADPELTRDYRAMVRNLRSPLADSIAGRAVLANEAIRMPIVDPDAITLASPAEWRPVVRRMNVSSVLVAPMRMRGAPVGSISLFRQGPGRPYTEADQSLLQDLADRAAIAVDSARLHAELEHRVAERTAELRGVVVELEAFSYAASHDLQAPLRAIEGFSQILAEDYGPTLDAQATEYLEMVAGGARRMRTLIDALLQLSKSSHTTMRRQSVNLSVLAAEIVSRLRTEAPARAVDVHIQPDLDADVDPNLADVLLTNLLSNAWKFTSGTTAARIELTAATPDHARSRVFVVRDNGAGFNPKNANRLFAPFQRLHAASQFGGTGIGLATVDRIVRRHGGTIRAEGTEGGGAAFFFSLSPPP